MDHDQPLRITRPSRLKRAAEVWARVRRHPPTIIGLLIVFFLLMAVLGPVVAPYKFSAQIPADALQGPSVTHWFGTDQFGRDVMSRLLWGARDIFLVAGFGTILAVSAGSVLGLLSGYAGRWVDEGVMRFLDVLLALPPLLLAMVLLGSVGPSRLNIILVVGVLYVPMVARVVRSVVLDIKTREFVEAAKLRGERSSYIMAREILLGTVRGDIHDIGKDIVGFVLDINGFEVVDLGINVPEGTFVEAVREHRPQVLALSGFLSLAFDSMKSTIAQVGEAGLADDLHVCVRYSNS